MRTPIDKVLHNIQVAMLSSNPQRFISTAVVVVVLDETPQQLSNRLHMPVASSSDHGGRLSSTRNVAVAV